VEGLNPPSTNNKTSSKKKLAVVLFNLGGPDCLEAVRPFLFNLFNDKAIIGAPAPIRWWLARRISKRRAPIAQDIYRQIGGSSPLLPLTQDQAQGLEQILAKQFGDWDSKCFIAMRYWHPMTRPIVAEVKAWQADQILLLPLYPQYSTSTSQSSIQLWRWEAKRQKLTTPTQEICCYPEQAGFIEAVADLIKPALQQVQNQTSQQPRLLFSAHGLPKVLIDKGDPYQAHVERSAKAVTARLMASDWPDLDWQICYQSKVGPLEWIGPSTDHEIEWAGAEGKALVVVPIAFVSEHSETLVELDIEYAHLAREKGVPAYVRVPAVGTHPLFLQGLADLLQGALASKANPCGDVCPPEALCCPRRNP